MSALSDAKLRMREKAEHHLRMDAMRRLRADAPGTVDPYPDRKGLFWRYLFVPVYRRVPWEFKQKAMTTARMTATGWTAPTREPGEPWRPPDTSKNGS